jgi:hypothetical protein
MDFVNIVGFTAAALVIATLSMRTMIPLRIVGITSNMAFIAYGVMFHSTPTILLHSILLPLNIYRLIEIRTLIAQIKAASQGDLSMDWLKPFMSRRSFKAGDVLFRKGDEADRLFYVLAGRLHLQEIGVEIAAGALVGELGMLAPGRVRTQTLVCTESGTLLEITYERVEELYFQNPKFGFYFLRLSTGRLFENIVRLEEALATRDAPERSVAR